MFLVLALGMQVDGAVVEEVRKNLKEIKDGVDANKKKQDDLATAFEAEKKAFEAEKKANEQIRQELKKAQDEISQLRRIQLARGGISPGVRRQGFLSDEAAARLAAKCILVHARHGKLDELGNRDPLIKAALDTLGLEMKATLTTGDMPLPQADTAEMKELIAEYGVCRRVMSPYPLARGTSRPRRMGTEDDFALLTIAAAIAEKNVNVSYATLESHKVGGIVRYPREIDEQSIVPLGQYLGRYGARKFAKVEDLFGFLADGTAGTYESIKGVCKIAVDLGYVITLGATKTAPSDATLEDFRSLRGKVASPVLASGKYYMHITWERRLRTFKTAADPMIYVQNGPGGQPTLDGYPIVWTETMQPYGTDAAAGKYVAVFGDLSYWWFAQHGSQRVDFSSDVYFATDELATRFIEEFDFDYAAGDCAAVLRTAAA